MKNIYQFQKNTNPKYRWVWNQEAMMINQFLRYAKSNPDDILNLKKDEIESLLDQYADSLKGINVESTIINKVYAVILFFSANGMEIENELLVDYSKEDYGEEFA